MTRKREVLPGLLEGSWHTRAVTDKDMLRLQWPSSAFVSGIQCELPVARIADINLDLWRMRAFRIPIASPPAMN